MNKPILFYDGSCPLCRREINHYIKLDRQGAINWLNIVDQPRELAELKLSTEEAMRFIHGVTVDGKLVRGVDAFMLVWHELPYYRHLARLIQTLRLKSVLDFAYKKFARWRFNRRCASGQCSL